MSISAKKGTTRPPFWCRRSTVLSCLPAAAPLSPVLTVILEITSYANKPVRRTALRVGIRCASDEIAVWNLGAATPERTYPCINR